MANRSNIEQVSLGVFPRTPDSRWVNEEVARFQKMGLTDRVFALLTEGEPEHSFPPALRSAEPLAADAQSVAFRVGGFCRLQGV